MKQTATTTTDYDTGHGTGTESSPEADYRPTIGDVDHTHPHTDAPFGAAIAYKRGPTIVADGGKPGPAEGAETDAEGSEESEATAENKGADERMSDVDHAPPNDETVNRVHERGGEGREER